MRTPLLLRRLDQRILPPIGRALSGFSRGTRRGRLVMVVSSVMSVAVVLLTVYVATRSPSVPQRAEGSGARVGVAVGDSIPLYVQTAHDSLQAQIGAHPGTDGEKVVALASLDAYVTPQQLMVLVQGVAVLRVFTHVHVEGAKTDVLRFGAYSNLVNAMRDASRHNVLHAKDDQQLQRMATGDTVEERTLRDGYKADEALQVTQAKAYASLCACVFAMVVYALPVELGSLATRLHVRAVDPVVNIVSLSNVIFAPPRPEEHDRADAQDGVSVPSDSDA